MEVEILVDRECGSRRVLSKFAMSMYTDSRSNRGIFHHRQKDRSENGLSFGL